MAQRSLIVAATSGLANRLLLLAGAVRVARLTQRELFLYWPENDQLGCSFNALFKETVPMIREQDMHDLLRSDRAMKVYNAWRCPPLYEQLSPDGDPCAEIVLIKGWTAPRFANETPADIRDELCQYLQQLTPQDALREAAGRVALPERCLGVHVRRGDPAWEFIDDYRQSQDAHFTTLMQAVLEVVPEAQFFLATDHPPAEAAFRERFGHSIVIYPKTSLQRHAQAMQEAMMDLLLLSRTAGVIGTHGSTFSQVAALLGPRLLVIARPATATEQLGATTRRLSNALRGAPEPHLEL